MEVLKNVTKFFKEILGIKTDSTDLKDFKIEEAHKTQRDRDRASYATRHKDHSRSGSSSHYQGRGRNPNSRGSGDYRGRNERGEGTRDYSSRERQGQNRYQERDRQSGYRNAGSGNFSGGARGGRNQRSWKDRGDTRPRYEPRTDSGHRSNRVEEKQPEISSGPKEERKFLVGTVSDYLSNIGVAVVKVQKGAVQVNDHLAFEGTVTKFSQKITSMQMDHAPVNVARVGQEVGMKVQEAVREGDQVFRVAFVTPAAKN